MVLPKGEGAYLPPFCSPEMDTALLTQAFLAAAFFLGLAGLDLPKEALAILPFLVLISPRPMS